MIIAIDGPAGSGKSSTARALARSLGGFYLDTGAMYRAMALAFHRRGIPQTDAAAREAADDVRIDLALDEHDSRVLLNGEDVTHKIRSSEVTQASSIISQLPSVRSRLVEEQRRLAQAFSAAGRAVVIEGRDIGTVVFQDADVKFFMVADAETRARRRLKELEEAGEEADLADVLGGIRQRDRQDEEREHSPLRKASDAVTVDTTDLSPSEQLALMLDVIATLRDRESS